MRTQILIYIAVTRLLAWLFRSARRTVALNAEGALELRYPPTIAWLGHGSIAFGIVLFLLGGVSPSDVNDNLPFYLMVGAFILAGIYFLAEGATVVLVTDTGVIKTSIFRNRQRTSWQEVSDVRFASVLQYLILTTTDGHKIRVSPLRIGFAELLHILRVNLGPRAEPAATKAERYATRIGRR